jgi:hypothetical protein
MRFLVFRHNHSGWMRVPVEAETEEGAMLTAIYLAAPWLMDYKHMITFKRDDLGVIDRYVIDYTGDPRGVAFGRVQYPGFWWTENIRIGVEDDCDYCGGTGRDHYGIFGPCWSCKGSKKNKSVA